MLQDNTMHLLLRAVSIFLVVSLVTAVSPISAKTPPSGQHAERPAPLTRDPNTPGYVTAKEMADGSTPPANVDGSFIIGPTHDVPPEMSAQSSLPKGRVIEFTTELGAEQNLSRIARDANTTFGSVDPAVPAVIVVTTSPPARYTRRVAVSVLGHVRGRHRAVHRRSRRPRPAAFFCSRHLDCPTQGPGNDCNFHRQRKRGRARQWNVVLSTTPCPESTRSSGKIKVLFAVRNEARVKLTKDPDGRGQPWAAARRSCALIMAWYPELYHRAHLFRNIRKPAVAFQPAKAARCLGVSRASHSRKAPPSRY